MDVRDQRQLKSDLKFVLQTEQGRRYLFDLMDFCGMHRPSMTGTSYTYYNEGMRNVALKIFSDIASVDADAYIRMMTEHKIKMETEKRVTSDNKNIKEGN